MTDSLLHASLPLSRPRLWLADSIRGTVLGRLSKFNTEAKSLGLRPRLVIFDYLESPVGGALRSMATDLGMLVGMEPVEKTLPASALRDRFRLLEKSRGIHGVVFPVAMTASHRACLEAHPELRALDLDSPSDGFSPQMTAFLQLAAAYGWDPQGRRACLLVSKSRAHLSHVISTELRRVGMTVEVREEGSSTRSRPLSQSECVWLCHGQPIKLNELHLSANTVVVDSGRAFELPASLSPSQNRMLSCRARGLCPAEGGLATLVVLHRLQRVLRRALGHARATEARWTKNRSVGNPRGVRL